MERKTALELAARIIGNLLGYLSKGKNFRLYQTDLNYVADCLMNAADEKVDWKYFQPAD